MSLKETKEAIAYGFLVAKVIKPELKDGFQPKDLVAVLEGLLKPENIQKLQDALSGMEAIPAEAGGVGLFDGLDLAKFLLDQGKALAAA